MPTLLTRQAEIEEQIERLEIHYLANPDGDLRFALLSDWTDAATETMPEDARLLAAAVEGIARLNHRHGPAPTRAGFFCCTGNARGTKTKGSGWGGSASAGSFAS